MQEVWTNCEGQVVDGMFPLRRLLGTSDHSGVFLTEHRGAGLANAALKLVPAIPTLAEAQLSHWRAAAGLSHPHLLRVFESGSCQLGEFKFLYLVMEYAEQNLSEILRLRPLTTEEAREMLTPTVAALAYLHGRDLVQGQLKPSNILVIGDQLKLAGDTVRPTGEPAASLAQHSVYDAPEAIDGTSSTAGDIWSLGVTLVEVFTQDPPVPTETGSTPVSIPGIPPVFADIVNRCLSQYPGDRPRLTEFAALAYPAAATLAPSPTKAHPATSAPAAPAPVPAPVRPERRSSLPVGAGIAVVLAVILAGWAAWRHRAPSRGAPPVSTATAPAVATPDSPPPAPQPTSVAAEPSNSAPASAPPSVLHQDIPEVGLSSRETIHGHIKVTVRVSVDNAGNVVKTTLENPGPSNYFARRATESAKKWKFSPAAPPAAQSWQIRYQFGKEGTTAQASIARR